ncbi:innexin-11-like [Argopecten irradians]|uniref:innexin-11-like n=1 Tax=Argopecten irradians TaxID=31199 RepID=UPI0037208ECF
MVWRPIVQCFTQSSLRLNDPCGRLSSTWTVAILVLFAMLTFYIQNSYEPVTCWTPPEFTGAMNKYANRICSYSENQYPSNGTGQTDQGIIRFKWRLLPLILLVQALMFKIPNFVLSAGQGLIGFRSTKISGLTDGYEALNMADRARMGRQVGRYLKSWIDTTVMKGCPWGWLTLLFLFTKLLYFINVIIQLAVLGSILTSENHSSHGELFYDIASTDTMAWRSIDPSFNHTVNCRFTIRQFQNLQTWQLQCVLNNVVNYEAILGFLWLWFMIILVITTISGLVQLLTVLVPAFRKRYIKRYLHLSNEISPSPSDADISWFAGSEITEDGVFILKAIGEASSEHLVRDAVIYLWHSTYGQQDPIPHKAQQQGAPPPYLSQGIPAHLD